MGAERRGAERLESQLFINIESLPLKEALGRGMRLAMNFMTPYFQNKSKWPYPRDVMYDEHWPMRQQSLLFAGLTFDRPAYLELWKTLPADSTVEEVIRNYFIRQPVLWVG